MAIDSFSGPWHFLSNFYGADVWLDGMCFPSTEHAYQAAKTFDVRWRRKIQLADTPNNAKRLGRQAPIRENWEEDKVDIMYRLVRQKFRQHNTLSEWLLETGDEELIEGNWWGDTCWGVCNGVGENYLGRVLMKVREELKERLKNEGPRN